jgi:hypothetical protein
MDSLVQKIFEAAKLESPSASSCQQAIVRAGQIAQAYGFTDAAMVESVFGSGLVTGLNDTLKNDGNEDSGLSARGTH